MNAPDVTDDDLPRPFGAYLLLQNFARGGMGEVFLAKSGGIAGLERVCVVKKLRAELTGDREYVTRFVDEARVVVTLNHANICSVFDVGRVATKTPTGPVDEYYLAMEYIAGRDVRSLQDRCRRHGVTPDPVVVIHLVCEVLKALDYAHRRRHPVTGEPLHLVHRDISPQNVLVSYEGEVKLIDFGLAASRLKVERTQPNVVMGKMAYMPPEQARGDAIDSRADLFACGVMLYELLANERYYEGMTANDIWQVAGRGNFMPRAFGTLDPGLQGILGRALHPDPQRRIATCGEFREALLAWTATRSASGAERVLRELMERVFADEIERERAQMARFGSITIAAFRDELESTQSRGISLAGSEPPSSVPPGDGGRIHEDPTLFDALRPGARTTEEGRSSSSSSQEADPTRLDARPPGGRIHDEQTMVTSPSGRTLRAVAVPPTGGRAERTEVVRRRQPLTEEDSIVDGSVPGDATSIDVVSRRGYWIGGAVVVAALLIGVGLVAAARDRTPAPPTPMAAPAPGPPTMAAPDPTVTPPTTTPAPAAPPPASPTTTTPAPAPIAPATPVTLQQVTPPPLKKPLPTTTSGTSTPPAPAPTPTLRAPALPPPPPPTTTTPVPDRVWLALLRVSPPPTCLQPLVQLRTRMPAQVFLAVHAEQIRSCALAQGLKVD